MTRRDPKNGAQTTVGPLKGLRVLEVASLAPAPFACMLLADLGADILRIDREEGAVDPADPLSRGRRCVALDLKKAAGREAVLALAAVSDVLVEGFRPGVAERLGIGPEACLALNPRLVYGRMTGWGQSGPLAKRAGHDINYIAISGALDPIGRAAGPPVVPLNLVGDFGGGGMLLAFGLLAALYERTSSGLGQVVDAAMVDGSALLTASLHGMINAGTWSSERGSNLLDGGAPFYDTYQTLDGKFVSVGAIERRFYRLLIDGLGLTEEDLGDQYDRRAWPRLRQRFTEVFKQRTRDQWATLFHDVDACVTPVLSPAEAVDHPHAVDRCAFVSLDGVQQPAPAPRFSRTPAASPIPAQVDRDDLLVALHAWGATGFREPTTTLS